MQDQRITIMLIVPFRINMKTMTYGRNSHNFSFSPFVKWIYC